MEPTFPELKDITPPTPPPFTSPEEVQALVWQIFAGVAGLVLLGTLVLWWLWRVRRHKTPPLPVLPLEQLKQRLLALRGEAATLSSVELGQRVGDAIRGYLQREHGLMARYRTTEELFGTARGSRRAGAPPPLPWLRPFEDVFARGDAMKFAGATASGHDRETLADLALAAVEKIRQQEEERRQAVVAAPPPVPVAVAAPPPDGAYEADMADEPNDNNRPDEAHTPHEPHAASLTNVSPAPHAPILEPAAAPLKTAFPFAPRRAQAADSFTHPPTAAFACGSDIIPI